MTRIRRPIVIENVRPVVDDGRYPVKRDAGERDVTADIFKEGHDLLVAFIRYRRAGESDWREGPLAPVDNDRWAGAFPARGNTRYLYTIEALPDPYRSWLADLANASPRAGRGQRAAEGAALVRRARRPRTAPTPPRCARALERLEAGRARPPPTALLDAAARGDGPRPAASRPTRHDREFEVVVDRPRAALRRLVRDVPALAGRVPGRHGTFHDCEARLPEIRRMGFDVVYLPPIHPDRPHPPQGREQRARRRARRPGQPVGHRRRRGRPHRGRIRSSARSTDFDRFVSRGERLGHGDRAGLRHPVLARPSLGARAPGVVLPPARRHHQVRGEPAQEVPGHLPAQLRRRRPGEPLWEEHAGASSSSGSTTA